MGTAALRYGITDRLEIEGRVPYLYRNDRIEVVQQRDEGIVRNIFLEGDGVGDAEVSLRYQLNPLRPLKPIWVASLRVKSNTGKGPFEIPFDEFGVATGLATGSGFWAVQPGFSFLLPSDPVVIYGGGVLFLPHGKGHRSRDRRRVHRQGRSRRCRRARTSALVSPLTRASPTRLGYRHNYMFPTKSEIGDTLARSSKLHVGQFNFGMSYRVTEKRTINLGFEFGVTKDAPDVSITLRSPFVIR